MEPTTNLVRQVVEGRVLAAFTDAVCPASRIL